MSEQAVFDALKYHIEDDCHGNRFYYDNAGLLHRTDGPAVEYSNGDKVWYQNGQLHRTDGPAIDRASGHKEWWQNDQCHRTDGPAVVFEDGDKRWCINGKYLTEAEFLAATRPVVEMTVADIEKLVGKRVKIIK